MNELIPTLKEFLPYIVSGFAFVFDAISLGVVVAIGRRNKRMLQRAKDRDTFTICPHCHEKVALSDLDFRLPSGELDNNLNGKPDDQE